MARFSILLPGALLLAHLPAPASDLCASQQITPGGEVLTHVCKALVATNAGDASALRALMADDFALTSVSGKYFGSSKDEMIRRWTEPAPQATSSTSRLTKLFRIHQAGTLGFVVGQIQDRTQSGSTLTCTSHAFTDIWELRGSSWKWVQSHESGYKEESCAD
jgi:ketosteroid isomerase-like protein